MKDGERAPLDPSICSTSTSTGAWYGNERKSRACIFSKVVIILSSRLDWGSAEEAEVEVESEK